MKIGKTEYKHGLFLAPMAGVTDKSFRALCKMRGAEGVTSEMVSSKALLFYDKKTEKLCEIPEAQRPCAIQLFGHNPSDMAEASLRVLRFSPCAIDINMGCPAPKIVNGGDGSALMKNPALCGEIVAAVRNSLDKNGADDIPVTVKIRSGYNADSINAVEVAKICESAGAAAVTLHGRTRQEMYSPGINFDIIKEVKAALSVPLIANGDITDEESAKYMLDYTGCDGIMIGRGALGNPYIFERIAYFLEKGETMPCVSDRQKREDIIFHMESLIREKGEYVGCREARKHIAWYIKGKPGSALLRDRVNRAQTLSEIIEIIDEAFGGGEGYEI